MPVSFIIAAIIELLLYVLYLHTYCYTGFYLLIALVKHLYSALPILASFATGSLVLESLHHHTSCTMFFAINQGYAKAAL